MDKQQTVSTADALATRSYSALGENPSVKDLVGAMREIQERFELNSVAVTQRLPDEHQLKLTLHGARLLSIERDDGWSMIVPPDQVC